VPPLPVLFVVDAHHLGGAEMALADLLEALDRSQVEPALVCPPYEELDPLVRRAARAGVPCLGRIGIEDSWDFRGKRAFRRLALSFPGVLHFNLGSLDSCRHHLLALPGRPSRRPPAAATLHALTPLRAPGAFRARRRRKALGRLSMLAAVSRAVADRAAEFLLPERIVRAPNFLPPSLLDEARRLSREKAALRARLGIPGDALVGLCSGPLSRHKGQELLVELLPRVRRAHPSFLLLLLGRDRSGLARAWRERLRAAGAGDGFRWAGWSGEPMAWTAASDLLLLPGGPEGFSRVVLEAMAAGLPVLAFRRGGVLDLVRQGETGLLAEPGDREAFLAGWLRLLEEEELRRRMGERGREEAARFTPERTLEVYMDLYRRIREGRPAPPGPSGPGRP